MDPVGVPLSPKRSYFKVRYPIKLKYRPFERCEASITVI